MEITYSLSEIDAVAQQILPLLSSKVVVFEGSMGMGKTTLIKSLVKALAIDDVTGSPTFGLVNHYESDDNIVYHFDFYRIEHEEEAFDIGFEEYLYSGAWCFIEWAERVSSYLPERYTTIEIQWIDTDKRKLKIINPSD
ncbi:tRNA (adenosine(37)-N6)-threonylcarbamoyltransferase complex ATPase subunit type 1 TsaE [Capnocytophaga cynodegmi]|uniref:tRNA threonylcarbamoyladenosine biosynthesis protein TsaE n=1 Tax=Capnocytophaga cynodegmi TaxID=28189 RepID=A0A250E8C4_9FLAO|nr:tRNA (adenosine(37)-N6)-threonylcarbamoyltransferase complex ATPase subunit type 1 TsaE [Capnocytophaga cynodegmi]ATA69203.1 tRNA (adenosine(37)-N6)-threonylcarbamoyltransferase complex ATPase subunit type 1 TsaE [Capnocytophaga cynodegmi]GJQ06301.1 tRNA (adenosine(37)-N6)-threonylcarbamoyltransferase complex ATPase subunit type 1 TsaE [Capnocytophaga cynodegmi]